MADGYRRWLYVLATASYRDGSGLADLDLDGEVADIRATFELLGYPADQHVVASAADEESTVAALRRWLATKGPTDVVAIYVTGHGETFTVNEESSLGLHTAISRAGNDADTIAPEQLLKGIRAAQPSDRVRNLLLVLDVCHAGAGLMESLRAVRRSLRTWHEDPGTSLGVHVVATTRGGDDAELKFFAAAWREVVSDPAVAPRDQPYLDLASLLGRVQAKLPRQILDPASIGAVGYNLCLPNPRHHLPGINPADMTAWWEPRARGAPPPLDVPDRAVPSIRRWMFTGRHEANERIASWLADPNDVPVLVLTAGPGSGKSTVLARMIALTVPDVRRAITDAGQRTVPAEAPPDGFAFAAAIWAGRSSVTEIIDTLRRLFGLDADADLAVLTGQPRTDTPLVVAIDAADEVDDPKRLAAEVLRPLAAAAGRGVVRLLVATRRPAQRGGGADIDLITPLTVASHLVLDLDDGQWRRYGDITDYAELLLAEPVNYKGRPNPYADAPRERRLLAREIETLARHSFLLAASVARRHTLESDRVDPRSPGWRDAFPQTIGEALRHEITTGYGSAAAARWTAILRPLAFAQGTGLSRDRLGDHDLWAALATALDGRHTITAAHLKEFLGERVATHLVTRIDASGVTFYRFHHESLAEQFLDSASLAAQHGRIVELLLRSVRAGPAGWSDAGPYLRRSLPGHARAAGRIAELVADAAFVAYCDPDRLYAALRDAEDDFAARVRLMLRPLLHRLPGMPPTERSFMLGVAALCTEPTRELARGLAGLAMAGVRVGPAAIRSATDHIVLTETPTALRRVVTAHDRHGVPVVLTTATYDVEAWNPDDGVLLERLTPRMTMPMDLLAYSDEDGFPVLAVARPAGETAVWDLTTRFPITSTPHDRPLGHTLCAGRLTPDRPFLVGLRAAGVSFWEPGRDEVTAIPASGYPITSVTTVPAREASDLVVVACGNHIEVWDPLTVRPVDMFPAPGPVNVRLLGVGQHGTDGVLLLAAGVTDGGLWCGRIGEPTLRQITTADEAPTALAVTVDALGRHVLAMGFPYGAVTVGGIEPGDPIRVLRAEGPTVQDIAVRDIESVGVVVATGDQIGRVQAWRACDGGPLLSAIGDGRVDAIAIDTFHDGSPFLVSGSTTSVRLWDLRRSSHTDDDALHAGEPSCLTAYTEGGHRHLATMGSDATLRVWDADRGTSVVRASLPPDPVAQLINWTGRDDRPHLAASTSDGLFLLDATAGPYVHLELGQTGDVTPLPTASEGPDLPADSGRSALLAVAVGTDVYVVDAVTGAVAKVLPIPSSGIPTPGNPSSGGASPNPFSRRVTSVTSGILPDGAGYLAAGTEDGIVWLWSLEDLAREPSSLPGHDGPVLTLLTVGGTAPVLAVGSRFGSAKIWNPITGELVADCGVTTNPLAGQWQTFPAHFVRWVALSDGRLATIAETDEHSVVAL